MYVFDHIYVSFTCSSGLGLQATFTSSAVFVSEINQAQSTWTATTYPQFERLNIEEIMSMTGGRRTKG